MRAQVHRKFTQGDTHDAHCTTTAKKGSSLPTNQPRQEAADVPSQPPPRLSSPSFPNRTTNHRSPTIQLTNHPNSPPTICPPTRPPTDSPTHPPTHPPTHRLTHPPTQPPTQRLLLLHPLLLRPLLLLLFFYYYYFYYDYDYD